MNTKVFKMGLLTTLLCGSRGLGGGGGVGWEWGAGGFDPCFCTFLGCRGRESWDFANIFLFPDVLSLKLFGSWWANYT